MELISVLIPTYNSEAFIRDSIDSVLWQTYPNFELLIPDDGSTDQTMDIVSSYDDPRIKFIQCPHNFVQTRNRGLVLAKGKYIALLDHDDIMMPNRLQVQYDFMESHPEIAACGAQMHTFGKYARIISTPTDHDSILDIMLIYSPILNPTGFIRRDVLISNNIKYEEEYTFSSDYKLWSEIAKVGKLANIPKVLTLYRRTDDQTSVKYNPECRVNGLKVKYEMLEYFLENIDMENEIGRMINNEFIPAIDELGEKDVFSEKVFFRFMYELVGGLRKNKIIKV